MVTIKRKSDEPKIIQNTCFLNKLNRPVIIIGILLAALFFAIFMNISGLGILSIVFAIIFFFALCDNEFGPYSKDLLIKLSNIIEQPDIKILVTTLLKASSVLIKYKSKLTNEQKSAIKASISSLQKEIQEEAPADFLSPPERPKAR